MFTHVCKINNMFNGFNKRAYSFKTISNIFSSPIELLMRAEINRIRPSRERKPDSILTPTPKKIPDLDPTLRKIRVWDLILRKNRIENQPFQQLDPDPTKIPQSWSAIGSAFFSQRKNYFVRTHLLIRKPW